jgi:RNA polymerase sigma factor (sigma-70 family)
MPAGSAALLSRLRALAAPPAATADSQLLERFLARGEEAAFAQLVRRHGAMVLGVCRRLLRQEQDAEDAFQATFLVLARRAAAIRKAGSLGSWLHGVARRVAARARADAARRSAHEACRPAGSPADNADEITWREVRAVLDEELARLPERYRAPLVQCYLEGQTQDEAARQLGWSPRTLRRRLGRGRDLLRARLEGRGVALSAGLLAVALAERVGVREALAATAGRAAVLVAAGRPAAGAVSAGAARLAEAVLKATLLARLTSLGALLLMVVALAGGALLAWGGPAAQPPVAVDEPPKSADGKREGGVDAQGDPLPAGALARLGTVRFRHGGPVEALSLSADGKRLATGADDGVIRVWDLDTGQLVRRIDGLIAFVMGNSVALSPDGKMVATPNRGPGGAGPEQIVLFDVATGKELRRMEAFPGEPCSRLAFSPDGKMLAAGAWDEGTVRVWDAPTGQVIKTWKGHGGAGIVRAVVFSADGKRLVTAGDDRTAHLWDPATGEEVRSFRGPAQAGRTSHDDGFRCAALSPDGKVLATGSADGAARLWDAATGKELHVLKKHLYGVGSAAFTPDGKSLLTGGYDGKICVWEVATGNLLKELPGRQGGVTGLFVTPDGKRVVSGGYDRTVRVRDAATGKEVHTFAGHQGQVDGVAFSPDGKLLATASEDRTVRLWSGTKEVRRLTTEGGGGVAAVAFSPDGKWLAAGAFNGISLWDVATGKELRKLEGHKGWALCVAFAPDGKSLASGGDDNIIRLWDPATGAELRRLDRRGERVGSLAFSPDGKRLAAGGAYPLPAALRVWDPASGKELAAPPAGGGSCGLAFSPDGALLASAYEDGGVRLWDVAKNAVARSWKAGDAFVGRAPLTFSRDGRALVTGTRERLSDKTLDMAHVIRVWEVTTGKERCSFRGHDGPIQAVAVSPDGAVIASGSEDTTVLLWDLAGRGPAEPLTAKETAELWSDLASDDAARAFRAARRLARSPEQALPVLKEKLAPARPADPKQVARLIAELDSEDFATREKALKELQKLGDACQDQLRQALKGAPSAETRRQLEELIRGVEAWPAERLRVARALEVLERVGTPKARDVLKELAEGAPEAWLTREARAALGRLGP